MSIAQIFISYAREDFTHAKRLFEAIKNLDEFSPWLDKESLLPGVEWEPAILEAIEGSRFVIILLSSHSVHKTGFIQKEIRKAIDRFFYYPPGMIFLIPVRLEPCNPKFEALNSLHWVDLYPDWTKGFEKILLSLKSNISISLDECFGKLHQYMEVSERQQWISEHADYLKEFNSKFLIEYIDKKYEVYQDELYAIETMMIIAHKYKLDSFLEYVFHGHEIAKKMYIPYELYQAFGIVLNGARFLNDHVRTTLLRDIFENNIRFIESRFLSEDTSWTDDLILLEVTKRYITQKTAMYHSASTLVDMAAKVMTWDIPFVDLMIFLFRMQKSYRSLAFLVPILKQGFTRGGFYRSGKDLRVYPPLPDEELQLKYGEEDNLKDCYGFFDKKKKRRFADYREHYARLGALLRIGEYMGYSDEDDISVYGKKIKAMAIEKIAEIYPDVSNRITSMIEEERYTFFSALELQQASEMVIYFSDETTRKNTLDLIVDACYFIDWETGKISRVPVDCTEF